MVYLHLNVQRILMEETYLCISGLPCMQPSLASAIVIRKSAWSWCNGKL